jgi:hypothetical protein
MQPVIPRSRQNRQLSAKTKSWEDSSQAEARRIPDFEELQAREALQQRCNMTIVKLRTESGSRGSRPKFGCRALVSIQFPPTRPDRPDLRGSADQHQQVTDRAEQAATRASIRMPGTSP